MPVELQVLADELVQQEGLAGGGGARLARIVQRGEDLGPNAGPHLTQRASSRQRLLQGCGRQSGPRSAGRPPRGPPPAHLPATPPVTRAQRGGLRPPRPADGTTNRRAAVTRFQLGDGRHLERGGAGSPRETGTATPGVTEARPSPPLARTRPIAARADSAAAAEGGNAESERAGSLEGALWRRCPDSSCTRATLPIWRPRPGVPRAAGGAGRSASGGPVPGAPSAGEAASHGPLPGSPSREGGGRGARAVPPPPVSAGAPGRAGVARL